MYFNIFFQSFIIVLMLWVKNISAQGLILGKPIKYENPKDGPGLEKAEGGESKSPWIVVSDRDNNMTYDKPGGNAFNIINFRDWFYVVETKDDWIRIGRARLEGKDGKKIVSGTFEDYGWVERSNMLLWTNSLIDPSTKIHRKALLLNKAEDILEILAREDEKIVDIYNGPSGPPTNSPKTIFEFYFIYKYDQDNGKYLIGKDNVFSTVTLESTLVGWIHERHVVRWDTRIALEPNFDYRAFEERRNNSNFQVCAYGSDDRANQHAVTGVKQDGVYWSNDPVTLQPSALSVSDPKRFKGGFLRFPLLHCGGLCYRSGIIGEISYRTAKGRLQSWDDLYYNRLLNQFEKKGIGKDNYDILLVIEGTKNIREYREAIIRGIRKMKEELVKVNVVRFGVSIYRDIPEEQVKNLYDVEPMTQDIDKIISFLNNVEFARWEDSDPWTISNYGITQGIKESNMSSDNTNIVFLIGNFADYSYDPIRKHKDIGHSAMKMDEEVVKVLVEYNVHLVGIQLQNLGDQSSRKFLEQVNNLISQSATTQFQMYKDSQFVSPNLVLNNQQMPDLESGNELYLKEGSVFGLIRKPGGNSALSLDEVVSTFQITAQKVNQKVEGIWKKLRLVVEEGTAFSDVNAGDFAESMLGIFDRLKAEGKLTDEDLKKVVKARKYKLYVEGYIPKKIKGAIYPTTSFVLLMPESDLRDYIHILMKLRLSINRENNKKREMLYIALKDLVAIYSDNKINTDQMYIDQIGLLMQGISLEDGCEYIGKWGHYRIIDVLDKKKMKDEEIEKRINDILYKIFNLTQILNEGRKYEFSFTTLNETYYWIPVEKIF